MNLASKIILSCGFFAVSCSTPKVVQDSLRDSVVIIVKDTVILKDSIVLAEIPKESDKSVVVVTDTSVLETIVAKSVAFITSEGNLCHTLTNKDALLPIKITIPERAHTELRNQSVVNKQVEYITVEKELSRWQNFIMMLGYGVLIACVLWLINKIRKIVA